MGSNPILIILIFFAFFGLPFKGWVDWHIRTPEFIEDGPALRLPLHWDTFLSCYRLFKLCVTRSRGRV